MTAPYEERDLKMEALDTAFKKVLADTFEIELRQTDTSAEASIERFSQNYYKIACRISDDFYDELKVDEETRAAIQNHIRKRHAGVLAQGKGNE